ncbi:MAG: hypothetical protein A2Y33_07690 [Spirochaetes bacterium GWF1_51_8]|nr:MAG: hypothetical protein A2Y33_07690 [Spirochaetes bacterium GWF1_51_8]
MMKKKVVLIVFFAAAALLTGCTLPADDSGGSSKISLVTNIVTTEVIKNVYVSGGYLYAAAGYDGLIVYQIVNPSNLVKKDTYSDNVPVNDVVVKTVGGSNYAFIPLGNVNDTAGMMVLNVTMATNIYLPDANHLEAAIANASGAAIAVKDDGSEAYVADDFKGLIKYALAIPATGVGASTIKSLNNNPGVDISVSGSIAYIAGKEGGVFVVDVTGAGTIKANLSSSLSIVNGTAISGSTLVVADRMNGILVYDVSDPAKPKLKSSYDTSGDAFDAVVNGSDIFVANGADGILWLTIASASSLTLKGSYHETSGICYKLFYSTDTTPYIYAAYGPAGIKIFKTGN